MPTSQAVGWHGLDHLLGPAELLGALARVHQALATGREGNLWMRGPSEAERLSHHGPRYGALSGGEASCSNPRR